ncbi:hypothetical protein [Bacillus sp. JJ722]|uniref:hypothetical protein n=1 Tax=Bacillus sp. JJ722 TaxID=3122973 RepID=UPI002FFF2927
MGLNALKRFLNETDALFNLQNEIIKDKLALGINGLEWLVLNNHADVDDKETLEMIIRTIKRCNKDVNQLFKDSIVMSQDEFNDTHEVNWWMTIDSALKHLSVLRVQDYDKYLNFLQETYQTEVAK